jgi:hypothetical protein
MKGKPPRPRLPQEKKTLSYANDRRNAYGENDKASRKAIPLRKAIESRGVRHAAKQTLPMLARMSEERADAAESSIRHNVARVDGWRKAPDEPLAAHLKRQERLRDARVGRKEQAQLKAQVKALDKLKGIGWTGDLDALRES